MFKMNNEKSLKNQIHDILQLMEYKREKLNERFFSKEKLFKLILYLFIKCES